MFEILSDIIKKENPSSTKIGRENLRVYQLEILSQLTERFLFDKLLRSIAEIFQDTL